MLTPGEKTTRRFRLFGHLRSERNGEIRVQESSVAFEGAHCWVFAGDDDTGGQSLHLSVSQARELVEALMVFIAEAEADELTEPAVLKALT